MEPMRDNDSAPDFQSYLGMLRRRWWMLILIPALLGSVAYWFTASREPSYSATAVLLVTQASSPGVSTSSDIQAAGLLTQTYAQLASAPEVLELAAAGLAEPRAVSELFGHVTARVNPQTQLVSVEATYNDPQTAADVANSTAGAFVTWLEQREGQITGRNTQALQDDIDQARTRVETTSAELTDLRGQPGARTSEENGRIASLETLLGQYEATYANLLDIQNRLNLAMLAAQGQVSVVTAARAPSSPVGYPAWLYVALATLFGIGVAGLAIVLVESLDRRIRNPRDVYQAVGLPVLGLIPRRRAMGRAAATRDGSIPPRSAEAFRALRTRFQFAVNGRGVETIAVLSPGPAERRSAVASYLAIAFAEQGRNVVLVDGDIARQHCTGREGLPDRAATAPPPLDDLLIPGPHSQVRLLPFGQSAPGGSSDPLTRERIAEVLGRVKATADLVIINPAALGSASSDSLLLAGAAGDAVLVAQAGVTRANQLQAALEEIGFTGVNVLGVVLDGVSPRRSGQ